MPDMSGVAMLPWYYFYGGINQGDKAEENFY